MHIARRRKRKKKEAHSAFCGFSALYSQALTSVFSAWPTCAPGFPDELAPATAVGLFDDSITFSDIP
jgi:hypothetical protein